jgi:acyl-CoA thioesterase-2
MTVTVSRLPHGRNLRGKNVGVTTIESAWGKYPGYEINLVPCEATARVWYGDLLLAESDSCLRVEETKHADRLYFPESDVRWDLFAPNDHHSVCPFKGEADYWSLAADGIADENLVWTYRRPFDEVAGIEGYVAFYHERVRIELEEHWSDGDGDGDAEAGASPTHRFPAWGDATDLLRLIDVDEVAPGHFVGLDYRDTTRNVVEGGQMLAQAIVAASKSVPDQRVTSAYMIFSKAAAFDAPLDLHVDVLRKGRTMSTVEVRVDQSDALRSTGLLLLDAGAPDVIRGAVKMPSVPGPYEAEPLDMRVSGRELRIVNGDYSPDPDRIGPPEIYAWVRFRDAPAEPYLHTALMAQSTTHWTIAATMLPHAGFGEADAHVTLSTGILSVSIALHDDVDVTEWLLYANPSTYAGRGLAQGEGRVFTQDGRMVASYSVQAMIRGFARDPNALGLDATNAM